MRDLSVWRRLFAARPKISELAQRAGRQSTDAVLRRNHSLKVMLSSRPGDGGRKVSTDVFGLKLRHQIRFASNSAFAAIFAAQIRR
jgi:hypothetical protein